MIDPKSLEDKPRDEISKSEQILLEYSQILTHIKTKLLRLLALGLDMEDVNYFIKLHSEHNHIMRLLHYPPCQNLTIGNRCKEHSDYGTLTLLSTDGVSGLEIYHIPPGGAKTDGDWVSVPHVPGSLVVNIGTLLSEWSGGKLLATLHRVAGPQSNYNKSPLPTEKAQHEAMQEAWRLGRTSIAFFIDPNKDVSACLQKSEAMNATGDTTSSGMSVGDYIEFRSGGVRSNRSGVDFTKMEEERMER